MAEAKTLAVKNYNENRSICVEDPRNCPLTKHRGLPGDNDLALQFERENNTKENEAAY